MRTVLSLVAPLLLTLLFVLSSQHADAQLQFTPFLATEGIPTATTKAKDTLAADAELTYIATLGDFNYNDAFTSQFDLTNGKAGAWGYVFYSPSKGQSMTFVVVKILVLYQAFGIDLPIPIPVDLISTLNPSLTYANSDALVTRLKTDTAFAHYRTEYPDVRPNYITLGQILQGDTLPNGFPADQPIWNVTFTGLKDSSMSCYVAAKTGETVCRRFTIPTSAVDGLAPTSRAGLAIAPNPTRGATRITVHLPENMPVGRTAVLGVYNALGARVAELTPIRSESDVETAEFDTEGLPAGVYYCRVHAQGWNGTAVPLIIER